jgi:hypothetical protein
MPLRSPFVSALRKQLEADLPSALKARDVARAGVLRTTLAAIANAEAVDPADGHEPTGVLGDVARRVLTDDDVRDIVERERDELQRLATQMHDIGQAEEGADLATRAAVLAQYLS